mmetsp:Transcript_29109/g.45021  ORF Transcript_29109/g.45021 Transcript_29109/m.45021 type:complete len:208 (-) Transcript_29109:323-946(-)
MPLQQLLQRDTHFFFNSTRVVDMSRDAKQLGSRVLGSTKAGKPISAPSQDGGGNGNSLNIGHSSRATIQPNVGRERRLQSRLASITLQALNQRSFLSTNVSSSSSMDVNFHRPATATSIRSKKTRSSCLCDGFFKAVTFKNELTSNVDVSSMGMHSPSSNEATLNQLMGIVSHDFSVLTGSGFSLVGVNNKVVGPVVIFLHKRPFQP